MVLKFHTNLATGLFTLMYYFLGLVASRGSAFYIIYSGVPIVCPISVSFFSPPLGSLKAAQLSLFMSSEMVTLSYKLSPSILCHQRRQILSVETDVLAVFRDCRGVILTDVSGNGQGEVGQTRDLRQPLHL